MALRVGDVFWLSVTNPRTKESEERPVVIFAFDGDNPLIASFSTITSSKIEDFDGKYDKWKSPIFGWNKVGLSKQSYVKANCLASVENSVFSPRNYIGLMSKSDFNNALAKINEFLDSDEDYW